MKVVVYLFKGVFEHLGGGVALNISGESVELVKKGLHHRGNILLVDALLYLACRGLNYLDGDGVLLFVLIEGYGGIVHIRCEEIVHIICKVGLDNDCCVIVSGVYALDGLVGVVDENIAEGVVVLQLGDKLLADVDDLALRVHVVLIVADDGDLDLVYLAIGIPERVDIEPRVKRRKERN